MWCVGAIDNNRDLRELIIGFFQTEGDWGGKSREKKIRALCNLDLSLIPYLRRFL